MKWEMISSELGSMVRRLEIPCTDPKAKGPHGWLYQIQVGSRCVDINLGRYEPVFGETTWVPA